MSSKVAVRTFLIQLSTSEMPSGPSHSSVEHTASRSSPLSIAYIAAASCGSGKLTSNRAVSYLWVFMLVGSGPAPTVESDMAPNGSGPK